MLELEEGFLDVAGHGHVDSASGVVPLQCHAQETFARPFGGDVVQGLEGRNEVFGMFAANVLNSKVVDDKAEGDGTGGMTEEARHVGSGTVTKGGKMFDEVVVGQDASLREAVHSLANFDHDRAVVNERREVVLGHDAVGNGGQWNAHVFEVFHWRFQIKIAEVGCHVFCIWGRDDIVEVKFDGC